MPLLVVLLIALALAPSVTAGTSERTLYLRWPLKPEPSATYHRSFNVDGRIRSVTLRYKGHPVPRGFNANYIVDCAHRGPAFLNWNWSARAGYLFLRVELTTGLCKPGPTVAGKPARLLLTLRTD
jgi:hypothetical protein